MKVPQPASSPQTATAKPTTATTGGTSGITGSAASLKALNLQPGQLLNIKVVNLQGNRLTFTLPNQNPPQTYQAETQSPVKSGQSYTVKVIATQPKLQLQLQPAANTQGTQPSQLYRQLLPNMQPLAQALQQLSQPELLKQLPAQLQQQIQKLLDSLFKPNKHLSGKQLKQATENSGLFLENQLSRAGQGKSSLPHQDLKAQLLKLQTALSQSNADPSLQKAKILVDKMLNRITLNQIQSIESPWLVTDLPVAPNPYFKQINLQVRAQPQAESQAWQLTLNLETEEGLWQNLLHFNADNELRLNIWIENPALRGKVATEEASLRKQLKDAGITLKQISYLQAPPDTPKQELPTLIDIKI